MRPNLPVVVITALLALAAPAMAQQPPASAAPAPIEDWDIARVSALGQAIYRQDIAAARASDVLMAQLNNAPPADLAGWIVVVEGETQRVRFLSDRNDQLTALYDVVVAPGAEPVFQTPVDTALSEVERAQYRARQTAAASIGPPCGRSYNAVVMKDPTSNDWLAWLLVATTDADLVPVGGHYRFRISADGRTLIRRDALSASCLSLSKSQGVPAGGVSVGLVASHIVSNRPVETHVFLSLLNRTPLYVAAGDALWSVDGVTIRQVDQNR